MARNAAALIQQIGAKQGLTPAQIRMMIATAQVESTLRPDAVGDGGHSFGLFQHNRFGAGGENAEKYKDPVLSITERARWFKERNITTPEGAYNLQRPADKGSYIQKLTAALGGKVQLNAPIQGGAAPPLGLGAEVGLPAADLRQRRIGELQSVRDQLSGTKKEKAEGPDLRGRTDQLRSSRQSLKDATAAPLEAAAPSVVGGPSAAVSGDGDTYKDILKIGSQFGLRIDGSNQTTGGNHTAGSNHYSGRAVDFGDAKNDPAKLRQLATWARANKGRIKEFYYDPLGWYIKNGKVIKGSIGGHGDHVHIAM